MSTFAFTSKNLRSFFFSRSFSTFVPALLIVIVTVYALALKPSLTEPRGRLPGQPLAAFSDIYPVRADSEGHLYLDKDRFVKAIDHLTSSPSPKAIADLVYLGQANNVTLLLDEKEKSAYSKLMDHPAFTEMRINLEQINRQRDQLLIVYKDIVDGIGQTFSGAGIEIVLHDTRDPLHSIVALQNPISGRRLGDTNTNFGLELIKDYSLVDKRGSNFVAYPLKLKDGRNVKSTTIPLFDDTFGLVGFICLNVDVSRLDAVNEPRAVMNFVERFKETLPNPKINELIENSKRNRT